MNKKNNSIKAFINNSFLERTLLLFGSKLPEVRFFSSCKIYNKILN